MVESLDQKNSLIEGRERFAISLRKTKRQLILHERRKILFSIEEEDAGVGLSL
jgi:hypothetical protein